MLKKVLWVSAIVLLATILYTQGLPSFKKDPPTTFDPKLSQAIVHYARTQVDKKTFGIPQDADIWEINQIQILKLEHLPGPHAMRRAKCKLNGYYSIAPKLGMKRVERVISQTLTFLISDKYPEGISVQLDN
ncbi:MAG TPA: hypothetical protein PLX77_06215 [Candidatus Cloacimonadota bacterium]|jgi:hypothetical protein|nr:hypothetical protein [Candidatus Cloacimonadota bacterium]